jgi:hypothetical protein
MVPFRCQKNLRLVFETPKRLAMKYAITIMLKGRTNWARRFRYRPSPALGAATTTWRQHLCFTLLKSLPDLHLITFHHIE